MGDDPPYLQVGTEVSAKYKGAFCEAKIRKVVRVVKCRVTFKAGLGSATLSDDQIKGDLRVGAIIEAKHQDKNQYVEATINKIQDSSQYTVVFDDGDITTLRRSALCLKSGRHFNESETLDQLPLTHPEHFSNPVMGGRRGVRRRAANADDNDNESSEEEDVPAKRGRKKVNKEADMGKVVCVESTDKKKIKDAWFPALIVSPSAQETAKIRTKDEYLVRSFKDGRYYTVPKKETTDFTKDSSNKAEHSSNKVSTAACEKAVQYLEKNELPTHWDRDVLFGHLNADNSEDALSESEMSEDDPREDKDRFVAQLYKFMEERGTPINKAPTVCGKDLDLYKLYKIVTSKGGYNKVTNSSQWKPVTIKMGYGTVPTTSTINLVKQAYKKLLHNFEEFYRKLGCPLNSINSSSSTAGKSRSNRSIIRDRNIPTNVKDSKKDDSKFDKEEEEKKYPVSGSSSSSAGSPEEVEADADSVISEDIKKPDPAPEKTEEPRRSRSRLDSRSKKDKEESVERTSEKNVKGKRSSKKREPSEQKDRDKEREDSHTPVSASPSPAPPNSTLIGKRGRGKYKKKDPDEIGAKSEPEDSPDHIGKNVKIQIGDKLQVYYGPKSKGNVTYEAKVVEIDEAELRYLVHYTGWNTRYDEWIERFRISSLSSQKEQGKNEAPPESDSSTGPGNKSANAAKPVRKKGRPANSTINAANQSAKKVVGRKRQTSESEPRGRGRRTRQKSGQDSLTQSGSGSDADSSDSEDKQLNAVSTPSSVSSNASSARAAVKGRKLRGNEDDDASSASSSTSVSAPGKGTTKAQETASVNSANDALPATVVPPVAPASSQVSTEKQNQVIDLNPTRSDMKGLDKTVKSTSTTPGVGIGANISSASVSAVSVCLPQSEIKLDVYEFQDDANDAPKLKMFAPRSPDKKEDTKVVTTAEVEKSSGKASTTDTNTASCNTTESSHSTVLPSVPLTETGSKNLPAPCREEAANKSVKEPKKKKDTSKGNDDSLVIQQTKSKSTVSTGKTTDIILPKTTSSITITASTITPIQALPTPNKTLGTSNVAVAHAAIAIETKGGPRLITPILHTPQQPLKQRAVISSFPPPLIPSGSTKQIPAVQIQPRPSVVSPPMPSLTQRPLGPSSINSAGLPLPTPLQLPQHVRIASPVALPQSTGIVSSLPGVPAAPALQPVALVKPNEAKPNSFATRQQELFPHLVQQAKTGSSSLLKISSPSTLTNATGGITSTVNPISVITPTSIGVPTVQQGSIGVIKEPMKTSVQLGLGPALGITSMSSPAAQKSVIKRKQAKEDKTSAQFKSTAASLSAGTSSNTMSTVPPKKKARKVITKNIMDLHKQKDESEKGSGERKPRKSNKKRVQLDADGKLGVIDAEEVGSKSPVKTFGKKKNKIDPVTRPIPPAPPPRNTTNSLPTPNYMTATSTQHTATLPITSQSFATMTPQPLTSEESPVAPNLSKPLSTYSKPSVADTFLPSKTDSSSKFGIKTSVPTLGVLKPEKKSYAPRMNAVHVAHMASCIDNVAKLPSEASTPMSAITIKPCIPTNLGVQVGKSVVTTGPTAFVKIPGRFDSTITIPHVTTGQATTTKPFIIIPTTPSVLPTTAAALVKSASTSVTVPGSFTTPLTVISGSCGVPKLPLVEPTPTFLSSENSSLAVTSKIVKPLVVVPASSSAAIVDSKDAIKSESVVVPTFPPASSVIIKPETLTEKNEVKPEVTNWTGKINSPALLLSSTSLSYSSTDDLKNIKEEPKEKVTPTVPTSTEISGVTSNDQQKEDHPAAVGATTSKEEDESCNSLLCEEIIPGSPPPGADSSLFGIEDENARVHSPTNVNTSQYKEQQVSATESNSVPKSTASTSKTAYGSTFGGQNNLKGSSSDNNDVGFSCKTSTNNDVAFPSKGRESDSKLEGRYGGRSKSPAQSHSGSSYRSSEVSKSKEVGKSGNNAPAQDRDRSHENNHPHLPYNNSQQQNLQHVMDNTPPTTPESSSVSSGSPRVEGGRVSPTHDHGSSSKSKDSSDLDSNDQKFAEITEEGSSSDAGRKYVKEPSASPQKKRHVETNRNSRNSSPPAKRRRVQRRMKSPDEIIRSFGYRGRVAGGRKGNSEKDEQSRILPPPPPINLVKPPLSKKYNLIPDLEDGMESEIRIQVLQQALQSIKEKYQEVKSELSSEERRLKRHKRRLKEREKERSRLSQKNT